MVISLRCARRILGEDFIKLAFEKAHEVAPEAKLFYNDYNAVKGYKRGRIIEMLKDLIDDGVHIDGIGIKAHWGVNDPSIQEIEDAIKMYADLGIEIYITELDAGMDSHTEKEQAQRYKEIFEVLIKYSDVITNVTFPAVKKSLMIFLNIQV